jgi:hypothetical protein
MFRTEILVMSDFMIKLEIWFLFLVNLAFTLLCSDMK